MKKIVNGMGIGIEVDEILLKQIKNLYINSGYNKEQMETEKGIIIKALKTLGVWSKTKIDRHFQLAIEETDYDLSNGVCALR